MKQLYEHYRKLPGEVKKQMIEDAEQSEEYREPNPQGNHEFHEYNFIDFHVVQGKKQIKLETYRHHVPEGK